MGNKSRRSRRTSKKTQKRKKRKMGGQSENNETKENTSRNVELGNPNVEQTNEANKTDEPNPANFWEAQAARNEDAVKMFNKQERIGNMKNAGNRMFQLVLAGGVVTMIVMLAS